MGLPLDDFFNAARHQNGGLIGLRRFGVPFDELTLSNARELEALVEVLVTKGVITKREVLDRLTRLRRRASKFTDR